MKIEISDRCKQLMESIRDSWFKDEPEPMNLGEFIYVMCCHIIYNKPRYPKKRKRK